MSSIAELLASQSASQIERLGVTPDKLETRERMEYVREQTLGAILELGETLDECGWKTWKTQGYGDIDRQAYALELADVLVFWTNLALAAGLTSDDVERAIVETQRKNLARQTSGY